jgi:hypothetical protein
MKKTLLAAMSACTLLYSCVAAAQNKPSPELEYINTLSSIAHHCNFGRVSTQRLQTLDRLRESEGAGGDCLLQ